MAVRACAHNQFRCVLSYLIFFLVFIFSSYVLQSHEVYLSYEFYGKDNPELTEKNNFFPLLQIEVYFFPMAFV